MMRIRRKAYYQSIITRSESAKGGKGQSNLLNTLDVQQIAPSQKGFSK